MHVAVIGANGGIGHRLVSHLNQSGHSPIGVVRAQDQFARIRERGGTPRLGDLEGAFASALDGADAVVFTAGSGGSTGWDKTIMVDLWGARRAVRACEDRGIGRFVMISASGASNPDHGPEPLRPYLVAKRVADDYLVASSLAETVLRPTTLTDAPGTGQVATGSTPPSERDGQIPRADVAAAVVAALTHDATIGRTIELYGGTTPIEDALLSG